MYIIWHDNDYDLALWVYENSVLSKEKTIFKKIPKTNNATDLLNGLKTISDFDILPIIKFATPDIILQKIDDNGSKILLVAEFMTHTPHHDHIFQRFERIYCTAKENIPVSLILMDKKIKIERGNNDKYSEKGYSPSNLTVHTYLKTSLISKYPTLMFFWPTHKGFPKMDKKHPTAPTIEGDIIKWFEQLNMRISKESDEKTFISKLKEQQDFLSEKFKFADGRKFEDVEYTEWLNKINIFYPKLVRVKIEDTLSFIKKYDIDLKKVSSSFNERIKTIVFSYNSRDFRFDPYAGFLCGVDNLFTYDNNGVKKANLVLIPEGIKYKNISVTPSKGFHDLDENLKLCPLQSVSNLKKFSYEEISEHMKMGCAYTLSKQQRIFGTVPDLIIFDDYTYYNKHYGN